MKLKILTAPADGDGFFSDLIGELLVGTTIELTTIENPKGDVRGTSCKKFKHPLTGKRIEYVSYDVHMDSIMHTLQNDLQWYPSIKKIVEHILCNFGEEMFAATVSIPSYCCQVLEDDAIEDPRDAEIDDLRNDVKKLKIIKRNYRDIIENLRSEASSSPRPPKAGATVKKKVPKKKVAAKKKTAPKNKKEASKKSAPPTSSGSK